MGRLSRRVRRIERGKERVVCRSCSRGVTGWRIEVEGLPTPPSRPCPGCGRDEPMVVQINRRGRDT